MGAASKFSVEPIDDASFESVRRFVYEVCGITLEEGKHAFVAARLGPILKRDDLASFPDYLQAVRADGSGRMRSELVDRITTNHTFFYRESHHFELFVSRALPEAVARNKTTGQLRVWCAASSTGQEPYTLAMLMMQQLGDGYPRWDAGVLATDISHSVLQTAREGIYTAEAVAALPDGMRTRYFESLPDGRVRVAQRVRDEVTFRRFNLMNRVLPFRYPFDVIFCRNVMIYFDGPTRAALTERLYDALAPGGYLFLGAAESLAAGSRFQQVAPSMYWRRR